MTLSIPAPMLAGAGGKPFTSPDWLYGIKFDGYRCLARAGAVEAVELRTKSGADCTRWYPEVAEALARLGDGPHVIDCEVCVRCPGPQRLQRPAGSAGLKIYTNWQHSATLRLSRRSPTYGDRGAAYPHESRGR